MDKDKKFDVLLGGDEHVPEGIRSMRFVRTRAKEIHTLSNFLSQSTCSKLIFQKLPKHMRRRTMSHNAKRLPRRVREGHLRQMEKSGMPPKQKRPSRKFRRKPKNLLAEYNRRKRNHAWLETHIWHAKRFHMVERWGYKLPDRPCDKAFRACYRASAKHCLIQDMSYMCCMEVAGPQEVLKNGFKTVTSPKVGLTINALAYTTGMREGSTMFYWNYQYPLKAIGEVSFVWKPDTQNTWKVWLWFHPSCHDEMTDCLKNVFSLNKHILQNNKDIYKNKSTGVVVVSLKGFLNRFRLSGPLANAVLQKSLHMPEDNNSIWLKNYLDKPENQLIYTAQNNFWKSLQCVRSAAELSPHIVLNLIVSDPRYSLPLKRTKALPGEGEQREILLNDNIKYGEIWDDLIRDEISKNFIPTSKILEQRKNIIVPDTQIPANISAIPIMLIQQPGVQNSDLLGYCSGWDIIIPSGWALPFWLSFIMCGGRSGGLRENKSLNFEKGITDTFYPDTEAGKREEERISKLYKEKYFRMPTNKRVNYVKLGIVSPFQFRWDILTKEWNTESKKDFYVLRDKEILKFLQASLHTQTGNMRNLHPIFLENCLIPVKLNIIKRGCAKRFALICLPKFGDVGKPNDPIEKKHDDINASLRKNTRKEHLILMKRLRKKRIRAKREGKILPSNSVLIQEQALKMEELWLPELKNGIRNACSRETMGFVTNGGFSFTNAQGLCVGYVTVASLATLLNAKSKNVVLVRDVHSRQYRSAKINICI